MNLTLGFKWNDGGRAEAGRRGKSNDCVVRAICIAADLDYAKVYAAVNDACLEHCGKSLARNGSPKRVTAKAMKQFGFKRIGFRRGETIPTYAEAYARFGVCIVKTTRHVAALKDGALQDVFDDRTYTFERGFGTPETRERKARSVWIQTNCAAIPFARQ